MNLAESIKLHEMRDVTSELNPPPSSNSIKLTTDDESYNEDSETLDSQVLLISREKRKELKKKKKIISADEKWLIKGFSLVRIQQLNSDNVVTGESSSEDLKYFMSDSPVQRLHEFINQQGLVIRDVPEDTDSMYHAVTDQMRLLVKNWAGDHRSIRNQVVQYLTENDQITDQPVDSFKPSTNWEEYLQQQQQSENNLYVDRLVLGVLSEIFERQVMVHTYHGTTIAIGDSTSKEPILLGLLPDRHYVSLWSPEIHPEGKKDKGKLADKDHGDHSTSSSSEEKQKITKYGSEDNLSAVREDLVKNLSWVECREKLGKYNHQMTYDKMYDKLNGILEKSSDPKMIITHINSMLDKQGSHANDYTLMYAIQGYRAAAWLTGDHKTSMKMTVKLAKSMNKYHVKHPNILSAAINYRLFQFNMDKAMYGKAYRCGQQALMDIQTEGPCSWTSQAYYMHAMMCDILVQLRPKYSHKYRYEAIHCYKMAKEHWLYHNCQEDSNFLYHPILYVLYTVYILLDMPALPSMYTFRNTHITLQRGSICQVNRSDIAKAEEILCTIAPKQIVSLEEDYSLVIYERIILAKAFINLRHAQLYNKSRDYASAQDAMLQGRENYRHWENEHKDVTNSWYNMSPFVGTDLNTLYQNLEDEIRFKLPKRVTIVHFVKRYDTPSSDIQTEAGEFSDQLESNEETVSSG